MKIRVIHACWSESRLWLWMEQAESAQALSVGVRQDAPAADGEPAPGAAPASVGPLHPFSASGTELRETLIATLGRSLEPAIAAAGELSLRLPTHVLGESIIPVPSPTLSHAVGHTFAEDAGGVMVLQSLRVAAVPISAADTLGVLDRLEQIFLEDEHASAHAIACGASLAYWCLAGRLVRWLLAQQRFVPAIMQDSSGGVRGLWQPWLADDATLERVRAVLHAMPGSARCSADAAATSSWPVLEDFITRTCDAACRSVMTAETMSDTIDGRSPDEDAHVAWLTGLLSDQDKVISRGEQRADLLKRIRFWVGSLDHRGTDSKWRLCIQLKEPLDLSGLDPLGTPGPGLTWPLSFHLQSVESPDVMLDAQDIWVLPGEGAIVGGVRVEKPAELLLAQIAAGARVWKHLEKALSSPEPVGLDLTTTQAYEFLREYRPILSEQGFGVIVPAWWDSPNTRLGVRLRIDSGLPGDAAGGAAGAAASSQVGLASLVDYSWQISIGDATLTLPEFERIAAMRSPLVMIGGRWVEVRPEDVKAAVEFIRENPGGKMELGRALRLAYAADMRTTGLPVVGMDVSGWASSIFGGLDGSQTLEMIDAPEGFVGSLRPYQLKGLSWLAFLDKVGLGACLADDMGLGKTIQFLALLLRERRIIGSAGERFSPGPTLLVVPMSVVGNWVREARRFAPQLRVYIHHGLERKQGKDLLDAAMNADLVVTTYALAHRDRADLEPVGWHRIALDEAQNIKNPAAKQTQAIRALDAPRRVALTGTPIENRLSELWSIMDFLNPGLLGGLSEFRTRFALPIERYHDTARAGRLRALVQPFVLRRLKSDPNVIADLPEKVETKEFCYLTPEQAGLYETVVKRMLSAAEESEGIQRRGIILAGLVRLKQICDHPQLYLKGDDTGDGESGDLGPAIQRASRSGKCVRLLEMLDEVVASGGQALVFTQFRQMGTILAAMLRHELDREVLFLHGGSTTSQRDAMVASFQKGDGSSPIFILSLKAGGVGLNLTAANHVFHFDRWWNPAVESQATDRAYRIGQTRTVQVHKFVVSGTLEERIDQMIEQKQDLAANVIGSGENWLTDLNMAQLRDVLMLRPAAVDADLADLEAIAENEA